MSGWAIAGLVVIGIGASAIAVGSGVGLAYVVAMWVL